MPKIRNPIGIPPQGFALLRENGNIQDLQNRLTETVLLVVHGFASPTRNDSQLGESSTVICSQGAEAPYLPERVIPSDWRERGIPISTAFQTPCLSKEAP